MDLETPRWLDPRGDRVETSPQVAIHELQRGGIVRREFEPGVTEMDGNVPYGRGTWAVYLIEESVVVLLRPDAPSQQVVVTWTPCRFGGARPWLQCPKCRTKRVNLHLVDTEWGCRACHAPRYDCQRLSRPERKLLRAIRLRRRVGQADDSLLAPLRRPKHMKLETHLTLNEQIWRLEDEGTREYMEASSRVVQALRDSAARLGARPGRRR